ncbi:MAG: 4Fe-4S binding protein [Eggerthellaceae bacterium]|nr:4Fe-4S binding protein [Eggerthellaceae bacterium]
MARPLEIRFDEKRCIKCWACEVACEQWNDLPASLGPRCRVTERDEGVFPHVTRVFGFEVCRQCAHPACVSACPAGAIAQRPGDGIVTVDAGRCTRCGRCVEACPWHIPRMAERAMDKCDLCLGAGVAPGETPHCVVTCPTQALTYHVAGGFVADGAPDEATFARGESAGGVVAPACAEEIAGDEDGDGARGARPGQAAAALAAERAAEGAAPATTPCATSAAARERADAAALLGRLLLEDPPSDLLAALAASPDEAPAPWRAFAADLAGRDLADARRDLSAEFAAVLLGMSANPLHPYESVYRGADGQLMGPHRDAAVRAYAAAGLHERDGLRLPEDHLGIELAFLAELYAREAAALEAGEDPARAADPATARAAFAAAHLAPWVPAFCDDLAARAEGGFYRGLAALVREVVATAS